MPSILDNPPEAVIPTAENAPPFQPPIQAAPADPFAGLEAKAPTAEVPDPFAGLEQFQDPFSGLQQADDLDLRSVEDLDADRDKFSPVEYFATNPDVAKEPAKLAKLLEVRRRRDKEGLKAGQVIKEAAKEAVPTVGKIFGGLRDLTAGAINVGIQPAANLVGSIFTGDIFDPQMRRELAAETKRVQIKGVAESAAGTELSATGLSDLARTGLRKLDAAAGEAAVSELGEPPVEKSDQQLLQEMSADVEFGKQLKEVASGKGEAAKTLGLDADTLAKEGIVLNPEVIERLSLVDPLTIIAAGGVFKAVNTAGNVVFTAATRAAAENTLGKLLARGVTSPITAAGKGIELTGAASRKLAPLAPAAGAVSGLMGGGGLPGAAGGHFAGQAIRTGLKKIVAPPLEFVGQKVQQFGNVLAGSKTFQTALAGAAEGAAAGAPLAALSDDDKTAGAILGAGALLGGGAKGIVSAAEAPGRFISGAKLGPQDFAFPKTSSKAYGIEPALDAVHAETIKTLPEASQNSINAFRETVRDLGGEIYVLSPDVFEQTLLENAERTKGGPLTAPELAQLRDVTDAQGYFDTSLPAADGKTRRAVILNSNAAEVTHEVGHLFKSMLAPERQAELIQAARDSYTPEQIQAYKADYESRLKRPVSESYILEELIAENFSQLFKNAPIRSLKTPPTLLKKVGRAITDFAEELGLDLTAQAKTPAGAPSSLRLNDVVRDAAREVLSPRPLETPALVTPRPKPVSLSEAARELGPLVERADVPAEAVFRRPIVEKLPPKSQQKAVIEEAPIVEAAAPEVAVIEEARNIAAEAPTEPYVGGTRSPRELLGQIAESIATKEGILPNYLSAPDEPAAAISSNRDVRRDLIEFHRTAPAEARALWPKTFFPEKIVKTKGGKYQVQGWAPEVFASNAHKLAKFLAETPEAEALVSYAIDAKTKTFTPEAWQELYSDTQRAVQNYASGATGAGEPLVVPKSVTEAGGFAPPVRPGAKPLEQGKADLINFLFGFKLPETPRLQKGKMSQNAMGQLVSAATKPGRVEPPVRPRGEFTGPEAARQGIEGMQIAEVNPLRNQLEKAAQTAGKPMPSLIEAWQNLNLENIKEVQGAPEQPQFRSNSLVVQAGLQPQNPPQIKNTSDLRSLLNSMIKDSAREQVGASLLENAVDRGVSVKKTFKTFFEEVWPTLPEAVQNRVASFLKKSTGGLQPGDVAGVNMKTKEPIIAKDWPEVLSAADFADQPEYLEGTQRGVFIALLDATDTFQQTKSAAVPKERLLESGSAQLQAKSAVETADLMENAMFMPVKEIVKDLPEVPSGFVRLYHGEGGTAGAGAGGAFFTGSPEKAATYGPKVSYVDVPETAAWAAKERARKIGSGGDTALLTLADIKQSKSLPGMAEPPVFELDAQLQAKSAVETAEMVKKMSPAEFSGWSAGLPTSLTAEALVVGRGATDIAFVNDLKTQYETIGPGAVAAIRAMRFDDASAIAAQAQFFKEAYEASTGTGGIGKALRAADPSYEPPFPGGTMQTTQFQPGAAAKTVTAPKGTTTSFVPMAQKEAERIADAIYVAEGGAKAKKPYGILSVKVANAQEARQVAINTVRNNWKRWHDAGRPGDYIEFLAKRYAPLGVANDPSGLNKNWLKNVRAGLAKTKK
jgi:hypothetical protein